MSVALSTSIHAEWALAATVVMGRTRASAHLDTTAAQNPMGLPHVHLLLTRVSISYLNPVDNVAPNCFLLVMEKAYTCPFAYLLSP